MLLAGYRATVYSNAETAPVLPPSRSLSFEYSGKSSENRWNTENETELPNAYHYYQALNMSNETRTRLAAERGLNAREITADSINQELLRLGLDHISGILSGFNEAGPDPFETNKVLKFPSDRVVMLDDINEKYAMGHKQQENQLLEENNKLEAFPILEASCKHENTTKPKKLKAFSFLR